jgi:TonB family protein
MAGALTLPTAPARAQSATDQPAFSICIVFDCARPTTPASDAPPRVRTTAPIELPADVAATLTPSTRGRFTLRVDETGAARELTFSEDATPGPLAEPIRLALTQWTFDPVRCDGAAAAVEIPLIYATKPIARARDDSQQKLLPPVLTYEVRPAHPSALCRPRLVIDRQGVETRQEYRAVMRQVNTGGQAQITVTPEPVQVLSQPYETFKPTEPQPWFGALVLVDMIVDPAGVPRRIEVRPSAFPLFEPDAAAAVQSWRFRPALLDDKPVGSRMSEGVVFPFSTLTNPPPVFVQPPRKAAKNESWDDAPEFTRFTLPIFPTALARKKVEGKATAELRLDASGAVTRVDIVQASREEFGEALRAAVWDCAFKPARKAGAPMAARCSISARFTFKPEEMSLSDEELPAFLMTAGEQLQPVPASALDKPPRQIISRQPAWSTRPGMAASEASATLEVTIDTAGRVRDPEVVDATTAEFGYAAVQAAASWYFDPPKSQGRVVAARLQMPVKVGPAAPAAETAPAPR